MSLETEWRRGEMSVKWKSEGKGYKEVVGRHGESEYTNNNGCYNTQPGHSEAPGGRRVVPRALFRR